jgi:D-serine deaminase-like pyridoxal phosphate-dependent protein
MVPVVPREVGMTIAPLDREALATLETPAVVVDLDRAEARITAMAAAMRERGVALRPHAKTHKSIEFARRQLAAGAVGLTVATVGEAEVFADARFEDLFIAYPVIAQGPRASRLRRLAGRCRLSVGADSVAGIEALAATFAGSGLPAGGSGARRGDDPGAARGRDGGPAPAGSATPRVLIEVDVGGARTGVRPDRAGALARHASGLGLVVSGVFTHPGHGYAGRAERQSAATDEVAGLTAAAESLRAHGVEPAVVSAGSTPTAVLSARGAVTEERPGTYVFGDRQQAFLAGQELDDTALLVAATVVSAGSAHGFVIDAGAKVLAKDVAPYLAGHGSIVGYPDAVISRVADHHGVVELPEGSERPNIGTIVWVAPNHVCPVVNLVDELVIARGGRIVDRWPVDARGRNA